MITVIIPAYNSGIYTIRAVNSVIKQTITEWNIVIINDGSQDDTELIINNFLKQLPNDQAAKILFVSQENKGPSAARNLGVKLASGQYIAFLDSDDEWHPHKLAIQLNFFIEDHELFLCATAFGKKRLNEKIKFKNISFRELLFKNYFSTPTVMVKSNIFPEFEFDVDKRSSEDYKLWLQIAFNHKCVYINEVLANNQNCKRDYGESGLSSNLWQMELGELDNFSYLYKNKMISLFLLWVCSFFSTLKFVVRWFKTNW